MTEREREREAAAVYLLQPLFLCLFVGARRRCSATTRVAALSVLQATGDISDGVAWHGGGRELGMVNITSHLSPLLIPSSWEKTEGQYVFATAAFAQCMKRLRAIGFGHALLGLCPWVFEPDINFLSSLSHSNLESI